MRYLIDVPLLAGGLCLWRLVYLIVYSEPPGEEPPMQVLYEIMFELVLLWLALGIALPACAGIGSFPWLPLGTGGSIFATFAAILGILLLVCVPIGITIEFNAAAKWGIDQVGTARIATFGIPLALGLYAAWIVHVPAPLRDTRAVHAAALAAIGLLCLLSAWVSVREMARWDKVAAAGRVAEVQAEDERTQQQRHDFEALTDADPLTAWVAYAAYNLPADVRAEALRRMGLRPDLEAELTEVLASQNTLWSREGLLLITTIPFQPSARLEQPVRAALAVISEEIRQRPATDERDGDKSVDLYESYTLRSTLGVAERMAESAGIDLGDAIDTMQQAVAASRTSEAARSFPGQAAATKARIAALLAARHG